MDTPYAIMTKDGWKPLVISYDHKMPEPDDFSTALSRDYPLLFDGTVGNSHFPNVNRLPNLHRLGRAD
jgi:hypothetical protein